MAELKSWKTPPARFAAVSSRVKGTLHRRAGCEIALTDETVQGETDMYERLTDRARKVMQLANDEAKRLNQEYIGSEHILLGLIKEDAGVAANILKSLDIDVRKIR